MARTTIFEESLNFTYQAQYNQASCSFPKSNYPDFDFNGFFEAISDVTSIYFSIEHANVFELPKNVTTDGGMIYFGEMNSNNFPIFENYSAFVGTSGDNFIAFALGDTPEHSSFWNSPHTITIEIELGADDSTPAPSEKTQIINYIMSTSTNTNWNVLSSMLGEGNWDKLKKYVETTPWNMNRMVLESFFDDSSSGGQAVVGTAIVGQSTVG